MNSSESKVKSKLILAKNLNFNHEKLQKIELFVNEVLNYNKKYNLISKNSEKDIWHRHVLDSAQLIHHIASKKFNSLYHPESINDGFKIISLLSGTTNSNSTISLDGVSILKSKNQKWITFNCKMLWERDFKNPNNWISNAYYTELEPVN